ncbi:NEW3 domain-containing protein [Flexithrix dorotheae]|uniref:COG1470 family protein n=1 Tax=Flexithrix dorotheae TaxID=70993 RepID=UPI001FDFE5DB|nr:NEW3 domain-containing protein [Flexithrix dorotheae]
MNSQVLAQDQNNASSFTSRLINIEAPVNETFRFQSTLQNGSDKAQVYELKANAPQGWRVAFKVQGSRVTSIKIDPDKKESINIEINAAYGAQPSKYKIPVYATSENENLQLDLEAVVKGSYEIELTTPTGLLSGKITEGEQKKIRLEVKNKGTLALEDITLSSQTPSKWEATFSPAEIQQLEPGKTTEIIATMKVPDKTLAGDYISKFTAKNTASTSTATYRMTVKTSVLAGWVGMAVILLAIGTVVFLIRKFGRR